MIEINPVPPEKMTAEQRRCEIALLLASGIVRLRNSMNEAGGESKFALGFLANQSVHTDPVNNKGTES